MSIGLARQRTTATPPAGEHRAQRLARKRQLVSFYDDLAAQRDEWIARNRAFYADEWRYMRYLVPAGVRVLEIGCGAGHLLAALEPLRGVGLDMSPRMIEQARARFPRFEFAVGDIEDPETVDRLGGPFDVIVLSDMIGSLEDCQAGLSRLHGLCTADTRIVISYFNQLWRPVLRLGERIGRRMPHPPQNWLSLHDLACMLELAEFDMVRAETRQLLPLELFGLGRLVNRFVAPLPLVRSLCLRRYVVARSRHVERKQPTSCTVVIPCRNERDNIEPVVRRLPDFAADLEIIFIEGHSSDGTFDECRRVQRAFAQRDIKCVVQDGKGKADAVRKGFAMARGEVLIILDADLTVAPEDVTKFFAIIALGKGEFVNGTRLVYPMASDAMPFLNYLANRMFALLFSWLLTQRLTDTLCGTKAISRHHYAQLAAGRSYFGNLDPFGDFDLIMGAAKLNLKFVEVPIRYADRTYGTTQISRFRDGWLLLRMAWLAFFKMKAL
jgi:SAM-dependent methyltransferase